MNYPYFGQTGQGATSVPPSNQPTNVQQVTPQQNPQFLMNNQQFQGNQMNQPLFPQPTGSVYSLQSLRTELQSAQFQLSQLSQTSNIVNQLMPVAKPAYITCSPYAAAFGMPTGCGCQSSCGCC